MIPWCRPRLREAILGGFRPPWLAKHPRERYITAAVLGTPPWVTRDMLRPVYAEARRLTRATGVRHVVDHVVPLLHPYVCGLTVPANLRVVPHRVNAAKSNGFAPDQAELDLDVPIENTQGPEGHRFAVEYFNVTDQDPPERSV